MPKQTGTTPVKEQSDNQLPAWLSELGDRSRGEAHTFLLHFNVRDFVFIPGAEPAAGKPDKPRRIIEYLAHRWRSNNRYDLILYYSLSTGVVPLLNLIGPIETPGLIRFREDQDKMYEELAKVSQQKPYSLSDRYAVAGNAPKYDRTNVPSYVFPLLERLLTLPFRPAQPSTDSNPDQSPQEPQGMRIALVIDYLEHLAPEGMRAAAHDVTQVVETLQRWALDSRIHDNKHLIVLFASDLAQVSAELYANSSSIVTQRLDRPDQKQRADFLRWLGESKLLLEASGDTVEGLANQTAGLNHADLYDLAEYTRENGIKLSDPDKLRTLTRERKKEIIRAESRENLEIVEPDVGLDFNAIGGLEHVKRDLRRVAQQLANRERDVPKGMLFVGPPGTGKSLMAKALAQESKINMVKMKNVRSMWVGESERNLNRVLDVARSFHPVIIFVDEIDQELGARQSGQSGDSGTSARMFKRLLEFMGDNENRGKVIWIAASNRPDLVDDALLSRFDRIFPFMLPSDDERFLILMAMESIVGFRWGVLPTSRKEYDDILKANRGKPDFLTAVMKIKLRSEFNELVAETQNYSGREIETVVRRAKDYALDAGAKSGETVSVSAKDMKDACKSYKHNYDNDMYRLQTLLAIRVTNFRDFLPDVSTLPQGIVEGKDIDFEALQDEISKLQQRLRQAGRPV